MSALHLGDSSSKDLVNFTTWKSWQGRNGWSSVWKDYMDVHGITHSREQCIRWGHARDGMYVLNPTGVNVPKCHQWIFATIYVPIWSLHLTIFCKMQVVQLHWGVCVCVGGFSNNVLGREQAGQVIQTDCSWIHLCSRRGSYSSKSSALCYK